MKKVLFTALLLLGTFCGKAQINLPKGAIPFILDSHIYLPTTLCDTIKATLVFDTGADRLYLDKDYVELSSIKNMPFKQAKAKIGGTGNGGPEVFPILIGNIHVKLGSQVLPQQFAPIINLREILGRHCDGMLGNNDLFKHPLEVNYEALFLRPLTTIPDSVLQNYTKVEARFKDNRIDIKSSLNIDSSNSLSGWFRLDMGCGSALVLTNEAISKLSLDYNPKAYYTSSAMGIGGGGEGYVTRAHSFSMIDTLTNVVIDCSLNTKGALSDREYLGLIGADILQNYNFVIDYTNKAVYIKRNGRTNKAYSQTSLAQFSYIDRTDIMDGWSVTGMYTDGIAHKAGIEIGDVIIAINGRPVKEISWEEQRKGLGLKGETKYTIKKKNGEVKDYVLNLIDEVI